MAVMDDKSQPERSAPDQAAATSNPSPPAAAKPSTQLSRPQIMSVTLRVLREEGYDATTIRRIAGRLGCAGGSIYRYFKDKRDLLIAVAEAALAPAVEHVEAGGSMEDSARIFHQLAEKDAALYQLTFWLAAVNEAGDSPTPDDGAEASVMPAIIDRLIAGWAKRLGDDALAAQCWAVLHGGITLRWPLEQTLTLLRAQMRHDAPRSAADRTSGSASAKGLSPVILSTQPPRIAKLVQPAPAAQIESADEETNAKASSDGQAAEDVVLL